MKHLLPLLALLVASCGEVKTGGFETSDLQARVLRHDGSPVASARVWLVRSQGDLAPAKALDSAWTDASGLARFAAPADGPAGLGLDVLREDSMGIAPSVFNSGSNASVLLAPAHKLTIPADSNGAPRCFVPGSHFESGTGAGGTSAVIALPQGTWNLAIVRGLSAPILTPFVVTKDTIVVVHPPASDTDTASKPVYYPQGPDIFQDSFLLEGRRMSLDHSFLPGWTLRTDTISPDGTRSATGYPMSDSIELFCGLTQFSSGGTLKNGWRLYQLKSIRLPEVGFLAVRFHFEKAMPADSGRYLQFRIVDSLYSGVALNLNPRASSFADTFQFKPSGSFEDSIPNQQTPQQMLESPIWYFQWTPSWIEIRNSFGKVGVLRTSSSMSGPPTFEVNFGSYQSAPAGKVTLTSTRLYLPR